MLIIIKPLKVIKDNMISLAFCDHITYNLPWAASTESNNGTQKRLNKIWDKTGFFVLYFWFGNADLIIFKLNQSCLAMEKRAARGSNLKSRKIKLY